MNFFSILILLRLLFLLVLTIITYAIFADSYQKLIMKQSLWYKLHAVLNETDSNLISKAETISLYQFKLKSNMINKFKDTCVESNWIVCNLLSETPFILIVMPYTAPLYHFTILFLFAINVLAYIYTIEELCSIKLILVRFYLFVLCSILS